MTPQEEPKLHETFYQDLHRGDFRRTITREYHDLKEFMLTEERQHRLGHMSKFKRWIFTSWWLLKSLLLKLTPARRILLAAALVLYLFQDSFAFRGEEMRVSVHFGPISLLLLLFVLMLELKDKLLAKEELEAGKAVQEALMPPRSPDVPGWRLWLYTRSANEVGGDLVDFVKISDKRFGVAVGDVAGKGLKAALMTAKLQATLRALVTDFTSLNKLVVTVNRIFCRDSLPNLFASLIYLDLQADSGTVRFVNAGHLPPIILRGTKIEKTEKGGAALGLTTAAKFEENSVDLRQNDLLFVYSDGLTEAQNEAGEFFGEQRLAELLPRLASLSTNQFGESIVSEVDRFIKDARVTDDLSIAVLRRV